MRILILANNDGGLYQFRRELIEQLVIENEVICCVPNSDGFIERLEALGTKCIIIDLNRRSINPVEDFKLYRTYIRTIKSVNPDIVLTYTIKPNVYGGMACQRRKIPYISNITGLGTAIENGGLLSCVSLSMYKMGLRKASCVFFQNKQNKKVFEEKKIVKGNTRLIPGSGVNTNNYAYQSYPEDGEVFHFLFVGRIMKDKGIEELLSATEILSKEGKKLFLDVVGGCDEDYSKLIDRYEKQGLIKYYGEQEDVHSYYTNAQCVVLPSYHEGMANVMLEAASTGRPIISTRIPGCQETFEEGVTGFGCDARDVISLKNSMEKMLNTSWIRRKKKKKKGRIKMEKEFDRQLIVQEYINQIKQIEKHNGCGFQNKNY